MRGIMIIIGVVAVQKFRWVTLLFAIILFVSAAKMLKETGNDSKDGLENNAVMQISQKLFRTTTEFDGDRFFLVERGQRLATPLFMCLLCIEFSDLIFAVDSIPAVLGITKDPYVVYSSNIFAIVGLRSLYTVISKAVKDLPYLKPAVATVLGFVGVKMMAEYFHYTIPTYYSLLTIGGLLSAGVIASYASKRIRKGVDLYSGEKHDRLTS